MLHVSQLDRSLMELQAGVAVLCAFGISRKWATVRWADFLHVRIESPIYTPDGVENAHAGKKIFPFAGSKVSVAAPDKNTHIFDVDLDEDQRISFKTFKDWVSVKIDGLSMEDFGDSVGPLGNFSTGILLARDGKTAIEDRNEFGQEWQVRDHELKLFQTTRPPQHPETCILPLKASSSRRLGETVARAAAEKACEAWEEAKELCVYDVMKSGDIEMARAGGY